MAVTITRTAWIDDDGTGTSGTVINNAEKTTIYNQIDAALAQLAQLAGGNSFSGNQTINGVLTVTNAGTHLIQSGASGDVTLNLRNTQAGATARATMLIGNDNLFYLMALCANSSTIGTSIWPGSLPNGAEIHAFGTGGLALSCDTGAPMRFHTQNLERVRITPTGVLLVATAATLGPYNAQMNLAYNTNSGAGFVSQNMGPDSGNVQVYMNAAGAACGYIAQTGALTVAYSTNSDQRLKVDDGRASDLAALRAVVVHDFTWKADGRRDRGVFAQEAHAHFPRAVTEGTDEITDTGALVFPWGADYSKFVPDLIAGFQQHDAELAALRAAFATLKGSTDAQ
jgi:hypothetical protein